MYLFFFLLLLNSKSTLFGFKTWTDVTVFVPCIANITSHFVGKTDFLFLSEELKYVEPNDEIISHVHHSVVIQRAKLFAGRFGFFLLFPYREKSYESLFKVIQPSVYNKWVQWNWKRTGQAPYRVHSFENCYLYCFKSLCLGERIWNYFNFGLAYKK
jgi:hypothetical protein